MNALLLGLILTVLPAAAVTDDIVSDTKPHVLMQTTLGPLLIELDAERAPITVENFLRYVDDGHYDGTIFHRILKDFMAQGGGFDTQLQMKPTRAQIKNEADNGLKNTYGTLAMARTGEVDSATSQFFINAVDNAFLDHRGPGSAFGYCVFGKLVDGLDTFERMRNVEVVVNPRAGQEKAYPVEPVVILSARRVEPGTLDSVKASLRAEVERVAAEKAAEAREKVAKGLEFVRSLEVDVGSAVTAANGLVHIDQVVGRGPSPRPQDQVHLHYTGWLADGTRFASSHDDGQAITYPLTAFIEGWKQGVTTMKAGGVRWLVIPPELAYGSKGQAPNIPPDATLVFKVELISLPRYAQFEDAMAFVTEQGGDVSRGRFLPSGLWVLDVVEGEGDKPARSARVTVHYSGWLTNGTPFDSSRERGQPASFGLTQVIPGWTEGVGDMRKGGRRWLVIPYDMAYGEQGRPPTIPGRAMLVFDVELLGF